MDLDLYNHVRSGGAGVFEQKRGLIAVSGKEAVQFLDGMITNDMKTLEDGQQMLAAFPNAQGRLIALVRVLRQGDRFFIETEEATIEKVYQSLFRFTFAGDFFVEDVSEVYRYFEMFGKETPTLSDGHFFNSAASNACFIPIDRAEYFCRGFIASGAVAISDGLYETLRIESGIPKYGVDMDETTIVPELGLEGMISYTKGCYIGQEIIARIHFRGHIAKQLTGLVSSEPGAVASVLSSGAELKTTDGKNAGRITSVTYSPKLDKQIALAFVRFDQLAENTELFAGESKVSVKNLPFIN